MNLYAFIYNNGISLYDYLGLCDVQGVVTAGIKGAVIGYLKTVAVKKAVTAGVKIIASQLAPVAGQMAGAGMTAWEVYSFGETAYTVYVNSEKIREALSDFYNDPDIMKRIQCLSDEECEKLADQLGEVIGSFVANRKEIKEGIQKVKNLFKRSDLDVKSILGNEIGAIGDISDSKKTGTFPDEIFNKKAPGSKGSDMPQVAPGTKNLRDNISMIKVEWSLGRRTMTTTVGR